MAIQRVDSYRARELIEAGALPLEVLPASEYRTEHLPGARNIPLSELTRESVADLDPGEPIVVYCYDTQCDLSSRGTALLMAYGFIAAYDYAASKAAWLAMGWPAEGETPDDRRAAARIRKPVTTGPSTPLAELPEAGPGALVVIVDGDDYVLGTIRPEAAAPTATATSVLDVLVSAPPTVRPSILVDELAESMDRDGQEHILVTTLDGRLLGVVLREDLHVDR